MGSAHGYQKMKVLVFLWSLLALHGASTGVPSDKLNMLELDSQESSLTASGEESSQSTSGSSSSSVSGSSLSSISPGFLGGSSSEASFSRSQAEVESTSLSSLSSSEESSLNAKVMSGLESPEESSEAGDAMTAESLSSSTADSGSGDNFASNHDSSSASSQVHDPGDAPSNHRSSGGSRESDEDRVSSSETISSSVSHGSQFSSHSNRLITPEEHRHRLPETDVFGEAPHTDLTSDEVDIVVRHVLRGARKRRCAKTDEYCNVELKNCQTEKCRQLAEAQSQLSPREKLEIAKLLHN